MEKVMVKCKREYKRGEWEVTNELGGDVVTTEEVEEVERKEGEEKNERGKRKRKKKRRCWRKLARGEKKDVGDEIENKEDRVWEGVVGQYWKGKLQWVSQKVRRK